MSTLYVWTFCHSLRHFFFCRCCCVWFKCNKLLFGPRKPFYDACSVIIFQLHTNILLTLLETPPRTHCCVCVCMCVRRFSFIWSSFICTAICTHRCIFRCCWYSGVADVCERTTQKCSDRKMKNSSEKHTISFKIQAHTHARIEYKPLDTMKQQPVKMPHSLNVNAADIFIPLKNTIIIMLVFVVFVFICLCCCCSKRKKNRC